MLKSALATLPFALLALAPGAHAADAASVLSTISQAGYAAPYQLEYRYGLWTASATTAAGEPVDLVLNPGDNSVLAIGKASFGKEVMSAYQVRTSLEAKGYRKIDDIEFDDGLWTAEGLELIGTRLEMVLHPVTGEVIHATREDGSGAPVGTLNAQQISAALQAAGYHGVRDLDFDEGVWEADAINAAGQRVELTIDPHSGGVLREQLDN